MTEELETIKFFSLWVGWPGVAALAVWKIGIPLTRLFVRRHSNGSSQLEDKVDTIENNHLHEIRNDISGLKKGQRDFRQEFADYRVETHGRLTKLEAYVLNGRKK